MKNIQPLSDPDDIRKEADDATKEQYADYYVNQPAPDPLTWQPPAQAGHGTGQTGQESQSQDIASLANQNDPLRDQ
jgi:hypothetical protein